MHFIKYHFGLVVRAARDTWSQFCPSRDSAMRGAVITAVIWLILYFTSLPKLLGEVTDTALIFIAVTLTVPIYFVFNWICAPVKIDSEQRKTISNQQDRLDEIAARATVQGWLISTANEMNRITNDMESGAIEPSAFQSQFSELWDGLLSQLRTSPTTSWVIYMLESIRTQNSLAPTIIPMQATTIAKKLGVDTTQAEAIAKTYMLRDNLDNVIAKNGRSQ